MSLGNFAGGARLLRKQDRLGRLAPGFQADLAVVDMTRPLHPWTAPETPPHDLVVLRAGDVTTVLVAGDVVLAEGRPTRFDEPAAARALAARLAATPFPAEGAAFAKRLLPHLEAWYKGWARPRPAPFTSYNSRV